MEQRNEENREQTDEENRERTDEENMEQTDEKEIAVEEFFKSFRKRRAKVFNNIKEFLRKALDCLRHKYLIIGSKIGQHLVAFIKSLCLIHALYGYPGETPDDVSKGKS